MAGHIRKRTWTDNDGRRQTRYQARVPSPMNRRKDVVKTFKRSRDAEKWLTSQRAALDQGTFIDPSRATPPFREVAAEWRATWTRHGPKTRAGYEAIVVKHLIGEGCPFERTPVGAVTTADVQTFINDLAARRKPNTVHRVFTVLRGVFLLAVRRRYIAVNPCDGVRLPSKRAGAETGRRMVILTPKQVRSLAEAIDPRYRVAIYVAAYCGLRAGELWALRRSDIDLLHGTIRVERSLKEINSSAESLDGDKGLVFGPPKSAASKRTFAMPEPIRVLLEEHLSTAAIRASAGRPAPGPEALVFPAPQGGPVRHNLFYKRVFRPTIVGDPDNPDPEQRREPALPASLHGLTFHELRHTAASLSLSVSPDLNIVKQRLGHEDIRTTANIYGHLVPAADGALAARLAEMFYAAEQPDNVVALG